jgi:hypothetical protein
LPFAFRSIFTTGSLFLKTGITAPQQLELLPEPRNIALMCDQFRHGLLNCHTQVLPELGIEKLALETLPLLPFLVARVGNLGGKGGHFAVEI